MTAALHVDGTVDLEVDGAAATLTGHGPVLVLRLDQPGGLIDGLGPATGGLDAVGSVLADAGLRVVVTGPRGDVATLGAGVHSVLGRLLAGSARVRLDRPAAIRPIARARIQRSVRRHGVLTAAAMVAGALLARARHRRRPAPNR